MSDASIDIFLAKVANDHQQFHTHLISENCRLLLENAELLVKNGELKYALIEVIDVLGAIEDPPTSPGLIDTINRIKGILDENEDDEPKIKPVFSRWGQW
jgi:hypothetical protein